MVSRQELEDIELPLPEFFIRTHKKSKNDVVSFLSALENATGEPAMQKYLEEHPYILIQHLGGGHGRWVIPHKRLGAELVTDFLIGDKNSLGFHWYAIELESPKSSLFTASGDPSAKLTHAIRQISDWRVWLKRNIDYASRPRENNGLGLIDIDGNIPGTIIIGREKSLNNSTNVLRRQLSEQQSIEIHTYDWLVDNIKFGLW